MSDQEHEPMPIKNNNQAIWDLVIADMHERDGIGTERYGTRLQTFNGRNPLVDAYQETLDLAAYLKQSILELAALSKELDAARNENEWVSRCGGLTTQLGIVRKDLKAEKAKVERLTIALTRISKFAVGGFLSGLPIPSHEAHIAEQALKEIEEVI